MVAIPVLEPLTTIGPDGLIAEAARTLDLGLHLDELEIRGFTVIPPEKVASTAFLGALRDAVVATHSRRREHQVKLGSMDAARAGGAGDVMRGTLWEDPIFETALMNPVVQTVARAMVGHACRISMFTGVVKKAGNERLGFHCDLAMTEPYPPAAQSCNITYALTDYSPEDGSTIFLPGSHRLLRQPVGAEVDGKFQTDGVAGTFGARLAEPVSISCPAGSLIAWYGTTWHGAQPRTNAGQRVSIIMYFIRWYLRAIENYRAGVPDAAIQRWKAHPRFAQITGLAPVLGFAENLNDPDIIGTTRGVHPILDIAKP